MLPDALSIGVSYELFWHLNPKKLQPFFKAFELKEIREDQKMWAWWGSYGLSAFQTVISHMSAGLSGKRSDAKYIDKPIMQKIRENNGEMTEEEIQRELNKMLLAEEMWIKNDKKRGLPQTVIK